MGVLSGRSYIPHYDALPASALLGPPDLTPAAWRCRINNQKELHFLVQAENACHSAFGPGRPDAVNQKAHLRQRGTFWTYPRPATRPPRMAESRDLDAGKVSNRGRVRLRRPIAGTSPLPGPCAPSP